MQHPLRSRQLAGVGTALFLASALTAACDGSAKSANPVSPRPAVRTLTITITPDGVSPSSVLVVPPVVLQVVNTDSAPHMLHLDGTNLSEGCRPFDMLGTLAPGETKMTGELTGEANVCTFHDHLFHGDARFAGRVVIDSVE